MWLTVTLFGVVLSKVISQIDTSADLNCGFELACQWRNDIAGEDSGDFLIARNEVFAYTHGTYDGMQKATLISNTISCQLGGGTLTFWYYRTGDSATLEVCVRQPSGSLNIADLRCFPVFPKNHARQWLFSAVEFPPLTRPFEFSNAYCLDIGKTFQLLIRSNYIQPFDIIAIDDVFYDAVYTSPRGLPFFRPVISTSQPRIVAPATSDCSGNHRFHPGLWPANRFRHRGSECIAVPRCHNVIWRAYISIAIKNINSRLTEGAGNKSSFFANLKGTASGNKNLTSFSTNEYRKRLFPLHTSPTSRESVSKLSLRHTDTELISPCPFTDCSFDDASMCYYVSDNQLQDDEDLFLSSLIDLPSNSILKKWKLSNHKVANSLTGIMRDINGGGWFAYAGETDNPEAVFLMRPSKAINISEQSRISFYAHMSGKYGRLRVCLDSLQKCEFEKTGQIYFVADKLKKNYVIGLDDIRLLIKDGMTSAPCLR
ncbi:BMA-MAM-5 [Dirofilaria immitis]|nr:BMA-MAM-5 [Dirofilaria immitis]